VPLNYSNHTVGDASLYLTRYRATAPRQGTLFVNPGGPGGSGAAFVEKRGAQLSIIAGGGYDIVRSLSNVLRTLTEEV
jgi:hypothetical protein